MFIYHILPKKQLEKIRSKGFYEPESFLEEGFIHCSTEQQVLATANRRYLGDKDLLLLVIDPKKVDAKIVYEDTSNRGEKHPHIYGRLSISAIAEIRTLKPEKNGSFIRFPTK